MVVKSRSRTQNRLEDFLPPSQICRRIGYSTAVPPVAVYLHCRVLEKILDHAVQHRGLEVGGYLFGHSYEGERRAAVEIKGAFCITSRDATLVHFRFEIEDTASAERYQEKELPGTEIIGWYHTHPGHGVFMSGVDVATHVNYFKLFHRVALVIDPLRHDFAAFTQMDGQVSSLPSIVLVGPDLPRLAAWPPELSSEKQ